MCDLNLYGLLTRLWTYRKERGGYYCEKEGETGSSVDVVCADAVCRVIYGAVCGSSRSGTGNWLVRQPGRSKGQRPVREPGEIRKRMAAGGGQSSGIGEMAGSGRNAGKDAVSGSVGGNGTDSVSGSGGSNGKETMSGSGGGNKDTAAGPTAGSGQGSRTDQAEGAGDGQGPETGQVTGEDPGADTGRTEGTHSDDGKDPISGTDQGAGTEDGAGKSQGSGENLTSGANQEAGTDPTDGNSQNFGHTGGQDPTAEPGKGGGSGQTLGNNHESGTAMAGGSEQEFGTGQTNEAVREDRTDLSGEVHQIEELDEEKVFRVILPADTSHIFDFIMDPQQLVTQTSAAAYDGSRFEEGATLFFKRDDGKSEDEYSSCSDEIRIANVGTAAVKISLSAWVDPNSVKGISMTEDPDFTNEENPSLYLALKDGERTVPIDSEGNARIEIGMEGALEGEDNTYSFQLTGAVNSNADWSELTDIAPEVTVTWKVTMEEAEDEEILENDVMPKESKAEGAWEGIAADIASPSQSRDLAWKEDSDE